MVYLADSFPLLVITFLPVYFDTYQNNKMPLPFQWNGYRVEDEISAASYVEGMGIIARSQQWVPKKDPKSLRRMLYNHLNWYNKNPTPFISVSANKSRAFREAERRQRDGKRNVVVYKISLNGRGRQYNVKYPHFRHVDDLLDMARSPLPSYADYPCTEDEWLFFHCIPEEFIIWCFEL